MNRAEVNVTLVRFLGGTINSVPTTAFATNTLTGAQDYELLKLIGALQKISKETDESSTALSEKLKKEPEKLQEALDALYKEEVETPKLSYACLHAVKLENKIGTADFKYYIESLCKEDFLKD